MNPTCPSSKTLSKFLSEELSEPLSTKVARHLEACKACQAWCETHTEAMGTQVHNVGSERSEKVLEDLISRLVDSHSETAGSGPVALSASRPFPGPPDERAPLGRLGHYTIQEMIAEGAQGVLYRGNDETLNRTVAIKVMHQTLTQSITSMERFRREARLIAAVQSDHVVRVFQVGSEPDFPPYLVMEFVEGEALRDQIDRHELIPVRRAVQIVRDTAVGLQAAHQKGLIHRDVKPSNILLDQSTTRARLTDFGLAVESSDAIRMTLEGTILGTPAYMSPEQVNRPESVDARSDLYSLAVVFYELLTGEVPFRGTVRMTLLQVVHEDPRPPRQYNDGIPKDLETICLKAMSKDPTLRFKNAGEFIDELDRWLSGREILSRPVGRTERFWKWCRRNPIVSALGAIVALLLVALSAVMTWSSIRLAASSEASRQNAVAAQQQSDAAFDTLSKLIFELQEHFDYEETDIDELQKSTLQIALAGLEKIRLSAESKHAPQLPRAAALRRMGELLARLGEGDEGLSCLQQAESILRTELNANPNNTEAMKTFVDVLYSSDDLDLLSEKSAARINEAVLYARKWKGRDASEDATFMLADVLIRLAEVRLDAAELASSANALNEAMTMLETLMPDTSDFSVSARMNWMVAADLSYVIKLASDEAAALQHLQTGIMRGEQFTKSDPEEIGLSLHLLGLRERLVSHWEEFGRPKLAATAREEFEEHVKKVSQSATADWQMFFRTTEELSSYRDNRLVEDNLLSAERLTEALISIIETRLRVDSEDAFARGELANAWAQLGNVKDLLDDPTDDVIACFEKSRVDYEALSKTDWFDDGNWIEYAEVLLDAAEFAEEMEHSSRAMFLDAATHVLQRVREEYPDIDVEIQAEFAERLKQLKP